MNILSIAIKEVKQGLRNFKALTMMVLFPIVLMLILGTALSGLFDTSTQFKDIKVDYLAPEGTDTLAGFNAFMDKAKETGIAFSKVETAEKGLEDVQNGTSIAFVKPDSKGLQLVTTDRDAMKANLVESVLSTFIKRYNTVSAIAAVNPEAAASAVKGEAGEGLDFVKIGSLSGKKQPGAMDYYAVSMLTLIIMYASLTGAYAIKNESTRKTINRLLAGPVWKYEILTGKLFGAVVMTCLQVAVVILFSRYVLKAYWGSHMGAVLGVIIAEIAMAVSLGIGMAFMIKNEMAVTGALNLIIPVIVFLGGGYIPIDNFGGTLLRVAELSPLRWVNKAVFQVIYSNDFSSVRTALAVNLGLAAVLILISSLALRKEAGTL